MDRLGPKLIHLSALESLSFSFAVLPLACNIACRLQLFSRCKGMLHSLRPDFVSKCEFSKFCGGSWLLFAAISLAVCNKRCKLCIERVTTSCVRYLLFGKLAFCSTDAAKKFANGSCSHAVLFRFLIARVERLFRGSDSCWCVKAP